MKSLIFAFLFIIGKPYTKNDINIKDDLKNDIKITIIDGFYDNKIDIDTTKIYLPQ